MLYCFIEWV